MGIASDRAVRTLVDGLVIEDDTVQGHHGPIPIRRYNPAIKPIAPPLVWVHGGSFVMGGLNQLESHAVAAAFAQAGIPTVAVDYRRVPAWSLLLTGLEQLPGTRFPIPVDDVTDVVRQCQTEDPQTMLGGASAGACLSAAAALRMVRQGEPCPSQLLLAYGTFHAELPPISPELRERLSGIYRVVHFTPAAVTRMNENYAGSKAALSDPYAFVGGHDLTGMPPTQMVDADYDSLAASGEALAVEMNLAEVPCDRQVIAGTAHGFLDHPEQEHFHAGMDVLIGAVEARDWG